jgi:hypothetical protein
VSAIRTLEEFQQVADRGMGVRGMTQRELIVHFVDVPTPVTDLGQVAGLLELADDVRDRSLRDPDRLCDVPQASVWVSGDTLEYVGVIRHEAERVRAISGS